MSYENLLIGTNMFFKIWMVTIEKINKNNIVILDFDDIDKFNTTIVQKNIKYILPLSNKDYDLAKNNLELLKISSVKIIFPDKKIYELLDNKNIFTNFMLEHYPEFQPDVYYLNNKKLKEIEYPAIYKPIFSTNASQMIFLQNNEDLSKLKNYNNIQKFIEDEYEYAAFLLIIDGNVINYKIIRNKYPKHNIKKFNFPNNSEVVNNFDISLFQNIFKKLNYSGGACINFKFDPNTNQLYIFEINPRFGGTAFSNNFIYELICIPIQKNEI